MRYFTPELIQRLASDDSAVANAADAQWDQRLEEYEACLERLQPELPEHVRAFNSLLLHDAEVCSLARQGDRLLMVLHKDIPPRDLVILTYTLAGEPFIDREALPAEHRMQVMLFLYDELDLERDGSRQVYTQSILFSNGWELRIRFLDVQMSLAEPFYPLPRACAPSGPVSQSA